MESWTTSPLFPLTAAAVGALTTFALLAVDSTPESAIALGLGVFAALMAIRNWWTAEEERPMLAEELLGMHDGADALREDAADLRGLLTELAGVVEQGMAAREATPALSWRDVEMMLEDRIAILESRLAEASDGSDPAAQSALAADLSARAQSAEERAQKFAKALSIAVREMKRLTERVDALEAKAGGKASPEAPAAAEPPSASTRPNEAPVNKTRDETLFALASEMIGNRASRVSRTVHHFSRIRVERPNIGSLHP